MPSSPSSTFCTELGCCFESGKDEIPPGLLLVYAQQRGKDSLSPGMKNWQGPNFSPFPSLYNSPAFSILLSLAASLLLASPLLQLEVLPQEHQQVALEEDWLDNWAWPDQNTPISWLSGKRDTLECIFNVLFDIRSIVDLIADKNLISWESMLKLIRYFFPIFIFHLPFYIKH